MRQDVSLYLTHYNCLLHSITYILCCTCAKKCVASWMYYSFTSDLMFYFVIGQQHLEFEQDIKFVHVRYCS